MLPLLMDDRVDAADRPVQKEPAAIAHRRRSRGLQQQHTEQCNFDLHSPQKQTEMTGVFDGSTRSSSRAFIRCAARPEAPRTHRERRACAGTGATCQSSRRSCPRAVPRLPPSRRVGAPRGYVGLGEQPSLEAELLTSAIGRSSGSPPLIGCMASTRRGVEIRVTILRAASPRAAAGDGPQPAKGAVLGYGRAPRKLPRATQRATAFHVITRS
jgi:hypothetical protein